MTTGFNLLVGVIAVLELVLTLSDFGWLGGPGLRHATYRLGAFWASLLHGAAPIFPGQPVAMFFTHALLHGSFLHMAMNLAVLLALGRFTAERYGAGVVVPCFVLGAVAGGVAFGLISRAPYPMVGASGAVFAFLGIWTAWDWHRHRAAAASVSPVVRRVVVLAGLNALLFVGLGGLLAWEAHLGGFLAGLALGGWFESRKTTRRRSREEAAGD
jgi:membrane associated rhomboid family serine protease